MNSPTTVAPDSSPSVAAPGARLHGRVIARSALSQQTEDAMFALLASHFAGVERTTFARDLAEKSSVILIEDEEEILRGFSTLRVYQTTAPGFPVTIVYSGDTIVERGCWGSPALPRTWIHLVQQVAPVDRGEVYWLLLTSGYRTYRFLSVFFRTFYPRYDEPTPAPAPGAARRHCRRTFWLALRRRHRSRPLRAPAPSGRRSRRRSNRAGSRRARRVLSCPQSGFRHRRRARLSDAHPRHEPHAGRTAHGATAERSEAK